MKMKILAFAVALTLATKISAQTFTVLHSFTPLIDIGSYVYTNSDGAQPICELILSGNTLYGTTSGGGSGGEGTVFKVYTDASGFTTLHNFFTEGPAVEPRAGLILSGHTLYGTTVGGGTNGFGSVYAVNTDGAGFTVLQNFNYYPDGGEPFAGLIVSGNTLYGTASSGGSSDFAGGIVFKINTNGSGFTILHNFHNGGVGSEASDGSVPVAGLVLSGNTLYGTTLYGGSNGWGTAFAVNTDGTDYTNLHSFTPGVSVAFNSWSNSDGCFPESKLVLLGNTLFGTTSGGGNGGAGTVFAINTDGTDFKTLHNFTGDSDGSVPVVGGFLSGDTLYGTAESGGSYERGTVFKINTDGSGFTNLYNFTGGSDGSVPNGVIFSNNTLYGTTSYDGSSGLGTVFALSLVPTAPVIAAQSQSQTVQAGGTVTFTVTASIYPPPTYQWLFNGNSIASQTDMNLFLNNVQFTNAGGYSVVVTNSYGSVTSAVAQLTVFTNLVVAQTDEVPPPPGNPTIPTDTTHFKVFQNSGFVTGVALDPSKSTIVLTHGWNDSSSGWPLEMANDIKFELGSSAPNIVAWDWTMAAAQPLRRDARHARSRLRVGGESGQRIGSKLYATDSFHRP